MQGRMKLHQCRNNRFYPLRCNRTTLRHQDKIALWCLNPDSNQETCNLRTKLQISSITLFCRTISTQKAILSGTTLKWKILVKTWRLSSTCSTSSKRNLCTMKAWNLWFSHRKKQRRVGAEVGKTSLILEITTGESTWTELITGITVLSRLLIVSNMMKILFSSLILFLILTLILLKT